MFEIARGAMAYGPCYYPIFWLAEEQLLRVGETAVKLRIADDIWFDANPSFKERVKRLEGTHVITADQRRDWMHIWKHRTETAHPRRLLVPPYTGAIKNVRRIALRINELFP